MGLTLTEIISAAIIVLPVLYIGPKVLRNILIFFMMMHTVYKSSIAVWRGNRLYTHGKYDEAIKFYDEAIDLNTKPTYVSGNLSTILISKGDALCKLDRYDEALTSFDKSIQLDPKSALTWHNKGCCFLNKENAKRLLNAIIGPPRSIQNMHLLGIIKASPTKGLAATPMHLQPSPRPRSWVTVDRVLSYAGACRAG